MRTCACGHHHSKHRPGFFRACRLCSCADYSTALPSMYVQQRVSALRRVWRAYRARSFARRSKES